MRDVNARVVILANGECPRQAEAVALFHRAAYLVCCDGACAKARALGREPDLVVGDGDSLSAAEKAALGARFVAVAEQETNDLAKAFRTAVARYGAEGLVILGADGLRDDHFLGNVFRLLEFAHEVPEVALVTNAGVFTVVVGTRTYACEAGEAVSVFAPTPQTEVTSTGLVWPLAGVVFDTLWRGTLNRTNATSFTLTATSPILVYRPHPSPV